MQRLLFLDAQKDVKPGERAAIARAWCDLNEERRKLTMRPLPRSIDTTKLVRRGRGASQRPAEPVEPPAPAKQGD